MSQASPEAYARALSIDKLGLIACEPSGSILPKHSVCRVSLSLSLYIYVQYKELYIILVLLRRSFVCGYWVPSGKGLEVIPGLSGRRATALDLVWPRQLANSVSLA